VNSKKYFTNVYKNKRTQTDINLNKCRNIKINNQYFCKYV